MMKNERKDKKIEIINIQQFLDSYPPNLNGTRKKTIQESLFLCI